MAITLPSLVFSQRLGFVTSAPRIDSFPVVRMKMSATYNGALPQPGILPSDLKITEDGAPVIPQVFGCDESAQAAVVFCVDASTSIKSSAGDSWDVYRSFFSSFDKFISVIPSGSRYALVAFTDQVLYYPGGSHINGFYSGGNPVDSMDFQNALHAQTFVGFTNVDTAISVSLGLLQYQPFKQKAIVLVTDDAIINTPYYDSLFNAMGITLYVMELGTDPKIGLLNQQLTHSSGGVYMQAKDSSQYVPTMSQLSEYVFGDHCSIRYLSSNPCPWLRLHNISLTLNYKGLSRNVTEQYLLGRNIFDTEPPLISESSPAFTSRIVQAIENFPCTRGIKDFHDSLLLNFIKLSQVRKFPNFTSDSLVVSDSLQPARAVYLARDSANNHTRKEIIYTPKLDTLPPVISVAQSAGGNYQMILTEVRSWDRGLKRASLKAGFQNLILDSIKILTKRIGQAWLHTPVVSASASGCLEVFDSSGNVADYCIKRDSATGDTLPPVIVEDPVNSPRLQITGTVSEQRFKDLGIKNIIVPSAPNTGPVNVKYVLLRQYATFSVPIIDSLQPVRAFITASDSVGNIASDTLRYDPLPDNTSPVCSVETPDQRTRIFRATEFAPWDRGILSLSLVGTSKNLSVTPVVYSNVYQAQILFTVIDPFTSASAVVQAVDSFGNECKTTISIDPLSKPLVPFSATSLIDFATHYAPINISKPVQITNPNESPAIVTKIGQTGDVSVFSSDMVVPIVFQPYESKTFNITFASSLLGVWQSDFSLANDTMNLASIKAIGSTIGDIQITIDTVHVLHTQLKDNFTVSISAKPAPINLDTISFTLRYDPDLAVLQTPVIDCSTSNPLCNYSINPTPVSPGMIRYDLFRQNRSVNDILSFGTSKFSVPFTCFVSPKDSAVLTLENIFVSQFSTVSYDPGLMTVGSECADQSLRAFLNGNLSAMITSIIPNPANGLVTVSIRAKEKNTAEISLVDQLGERRLHSSIALENGSNAKVLNLSNLPSGNYQLILSQTSGMLSSQTLTIVR